MCLYSQSTRADITVCGFSRETKTSTTGVVATALMCLFVADAPTTIGLDCFLAAFLNDNACASVLDNSFVRLVLDSSRPEHLIYDEGLMSD